MNTVRNILARHRSQILAALLVPCLLATPACLTALVVGAAGIGAVTGTSPDSVETTVPGNRQRAVEVVSKVIRNRGGFVDKVDTDFEAGAAGKTELKASIDLTDITATIKSPPDSDYLIITMKARKQLFAEYETAESLLLEVRDLMMRESGRQPIAID